VDSVSNLTSNDSRFYQGVYNSREYIHNIQQQFTDDLENAPPTGDHEKAPPTPEFMKVIFGNKIPLRDMVDLETFNLINLRAIVLCAFEHVLAHYNANWINYGSQQLYILAEVLSIGEKITGGLLGIRTSFRRGALCRLAVMKGLHVYNNVSNSSELNLLVDLYNRIQAALGSTEHTHTCSMLYTDRDGYTKYDMTLQTLFSRVTDSRDRPYRDSRKYTFDMNVVDTKKFLQEATKLNAAIASVSEENDDILYGKTQEMINAYVTVPTEAPAAGAAIPLPTAQLEPEPEMPPPEEPAQNAENAPNAQLGGPLLESIVHKYYDSQRNDIDGSWKAGRAHDIILLPSDNTMEPFVSTLSKSVDSPETRVNEDTTIQIEKSKNVSVTHDRYEIAKVISQLGYIDFASSGSLAHAGKALAAGGFAGVGSAMNMIKSLGDYVNTISHTLDTKTKATSTVITLILPDSQTYGTQQLNKLQKSFNDTSKNVSRLLNFNVSNIAPINEHPINGPMTPMDVA